MKRCPQHRTTPSRVINRKRKLIEHFQWRIQNNQYGRLSKAKIHCSCWMCSTKSRTLGLPKSEKARIEGLYYQIVDHFSSN
ncbi:hypothetical protein BK140_20190 [Paenibacillus macerans]|nr:hypothetical protein BK140_20190 [Paenibacillus macerans]